MTDLTILMTGAGAPGASGIINCYRNNGERSVRVIGVDIKERIPTRNKLDAFSPICRPTDPEFCQKLLDIALKEKVQVIQPLVTRELEVLAEKREQFESRGIAVCCAEKEHLAIANDKGKLLRFMQERGMDVPGFQIIHTGSEFRSACERMGYPDVPVCFKPTQGNGSRGFRIIDEKKDLGALLFNEKPNSTYISFAQAEHILSSMETIPELLVMEFLPGEEYSVDVLAEHGKTLAAIPRKRLAMNGGISTNCIVEKNEAIIRYCAEIVQALQLHGNIGIQVRADAKGVYKILEINPRVQGSIVACAAAGANLPYLAIKQALHEPIGEISVRWRTQMLRYWNEFYYDSAGSAFTYDIL